MSSTMAKITNEIDKTKKTPIEEKFAFWYRISEDALMNQQPKQTLDKKEYENQVKKIAEFQTIEDFWAIFQHLRKPDSCKPGIEFQMFKDPIKPMWEDEYNKDGGRISIKLRKGYTTIIWEEMIFALIGGVLPPEIKNEINGIVASSRKEFNVLQIWFKTYANFHQKIEQCIRELLQIPNEVDLEVKQFFKPKKDYSKREFERKTEDKPKKKEVVNEEKKETNISNNEEEKKKEDK
jgi:translation initiation factor 4E